MQKYIDYIVKTTSLNADCVKRTVELLENDCTIPFIARYRKEATGGLNEVEIDSIANALKKAKEFEARKTVILNSIEQQNLLTEELRNKIEQTENLIDLEDIYLPYKPKRRTRATIAKEKGLEPLAKMIMSEKQFSFAKYSDEDLAGARDICAEWINENTFVRRKMRKYFNQNSITKAAKAKGFKENSKYEHLVGHKEKTINIPSHRALALFRAEAEGELNLSFLPEDSTMAIDYFVNGFVKSNTEASEQKFKACEDS